MPGAGKQAEVWKWVAGALAALLIGLAGAMVERWIMSGEVSALARKTSELEMRIQLLEREHDEDWERLESILGGIERGLSAPSARGDE